MLNYAGEYGEYCDSRQATVTVIRSIDAVLISLDKPGNLLSCSAAK